MSAKYDELEEMALMRLVKLRKARKLSQGDIGHRIGLSTPQVSRIESGEAYLRLSSLLAYCEVLSVSPATVLSSTALDATSQGALAKALAAEKKRNADLTHAVDTAMAALKSTK